MILLGARSLSFALPDSLQSSLPHSVIRQSERARHFMHTGHIAAVATVVALATVGCAGTPVGPGPTPAPPRPLPELPVPKPIRSPISVWTPGPLPPATVQFEHSVRGRPIEAVVFEGEGDCVMFVGGIHGNEPVSAVRPVGAPTV